MRSVFFALALWLVCPSVARACSCLGDEPTNDAEFQALVDEADAVFEGRAAQERWEGDVLVNPFEVLRSFKGPQEDSVVLHSGTQREGRTYTMSSCDRTYEEGKTYLVFAYAGESGSLVSGECSPTRLILEARPYLEFLEGLQTDSQPPPIESPSGCRVSTRAPTDLVAFALVVLLGIRASNEEKTGYG